MLKNKAFTLIEIIVVILMISIILSFASLSVDIGGKSALFKNEVKRLFTLLKLANQEAIMRNVEIGVLFKANYYEFYELNNNEWQLLNNDDVFRTRKSKIAIKFDLQDNVQNTLDNDIPQLLLLSSGEITPFYLRCNLENYNNYYELQGELNGKITLNFIQN
jgi:general secretion pathway protein H